MSDEGRLVAGRYRVVKRIGTGAMGAVWQAHDDVLHRTVAIKQLLMQPGLDENEAEDARARTMREGRIAARLHHPNAISVFDVVTDDNGQPCLIMEYLESTSLAQELQGGHTLSPTEVANIGSQVAAALKEAHAVGIVHRDIKPGNILLAGNGLVKITDFGISRAKDDVTVTKTGMIAGTPAYLAPEVAIGGDPGPESDVFSLGSTLYAATEGQPPFGLSENTLSLLHAVAAGQINPPRQSGPLTSVLAVMLHPETQHRPTAEECEALLSAVARGETPLGGPATGGGDDVTTVQPIASATTAVLGGAGAGALAGALAGGQDDDFSGGQSGTLGGDLGNLGDADYYGDQPADRYEPASGYPDEDYDGYDRTQVYGGPGPEATRAVPAGGLPYEDDRGYGAGYDDYQGYQGYQGPDDYDDRGYGAGGGAAGAEDEPKKGAWKVPALVGSIVVIGLAGFAFWLFGGSGGGDAEEDPGRREVGTTSNLPVTTTRSTPPSSTQSSVPEAPVATDTYEPSSEYVPPPVEEPTSDTSTEVEEPPTQPTTETTEPTEPPTSDTPTPTEPTSPAASS